MNVVVCSDLHADWSTAGVPRFGDAHAALHGAMNDAISMRAAAFLFLGDLCDPDNGPATIAAIELSIQVALRGSAYGVESHWIAGNHDVIEDGFGRTTLSPLAQVAAWVPGIHVYESPRFASVAKGRFRLCALPFTASSHPYDPARVVVDALAGSGAGPWVVAGHLHLAGIIPGSESEDMARGRSVQFPLELVDAGANAVFLNGHYHRRQVYAGVHVPGSMMRLTFGEQDNEPGYLVVEVPGG